MTNIAPGRENGHDGRTDTKLDGDDGDGRPDECECAEFHTDTDLPCWPCFRDGHSAPATEGDDEGGRPEPTRSEPADFGGGESTGVQDL